MSEYVVEVEYDTLNGTFSQKRREEIVRCRDCKWCMAYSKVTYCDLFAHRLPNNELDGFCAWPERKED